MKSAGPFLTSLSRILSRKILEPYRKHDDSELEAVARYVWNICLCEALHPVLGTLELGLQTNIHQAAEAHFHNPRWFRDDAIIAQNDRRTVRRAQAQLEESHKPYDPQCVVTKLDFEFWTSLFNTRYEGILWPDLLKNSFPNMPSRIRSRPVVYDRLAEISDLRQLVIHNQTIVNRPLLVEQHLNIIETVGWLNEDLKYLTQTIDRFPSVASRKYYEYLLGLYAE